MGRKYQDLGPSQINSGKVIPSECTIVKLTRETMTNSQMPNFQILKILKISSFQKN